MKTLYSVLCLIFSLGTLASQSSLLLDTVYVNASRISSTIEETGKSVLVLDQADIQAQNPSSFDDLLRSLPGLNINYRGGFGVQADIGLRGSTFSQVLILVDGLRINDPLTAHFNNYLPVNLSDIAQIEIIKGPASTSFGADAVGGIIHIKTKTFTAKHSSKDELTLNGFAALGQHNLTEHDLGINYKQGKLLLSGSHKQSLSDGEPYVNPNFIAGVASDSLVRSFFDLRTYTAAAKYFMSDNTTAYARFSRDERHFSARHFYTRSTFDESVETVNTSKFDIGVKHTRNKSTTTLLTSYRSTSDLFVFNPLFSPNMHRTNQWIGNISHTHILSPAVHLVAGLNYIKKEIESNDRGDHSNNSGGVFTEIKYKPTSQLTLNTGLRVENDQNFGTEVLPQINISYKKGACTFRGGFGKSIRAADFTERYISSQISNLSAGRNLGNPDLEAERAWNGEVGIDYKNQTGFTVSNTVFYRNSSNLIDYLFTPATEIPNNENLDPEASYFYATNISEASTFGNELAINYRKDFNSDCRLNTGLSYTFIQTTNDDDEVSKYLANHPKHNLGMNIKLDARYFSVGLSGSYIIRSEEFAEAILAEVPETYFLVDLNTSISLGDKAQVFLNVRNLLDTNYQEILGAQMPGRWFKGGVKWNIAL